MSTPRILVINPNTSVEITESVHRLAIEEARGAARIEVATAPFGARYISSRVSFSIAGHAVLDAYASAVANSGRPDIVIVGCFGDPGIEALREISGVPVLGFAQSGMLAAVELPGTFVIATTGASWQPILEEIALRYGFSERLAGLVFIDQWTDNVVAATAEIERRASKLGASRVVIGGTGLIPLLPRITEGTSLPVIDAHRHTIRAAIRQAISHVPVRPSGVPGQFRGLSRELEMMLGQMLPADTNG